MKRKHVNFLVLSALGILIFQFSIAFKNNEKLPLNQSVQSIWVRTHYASGTYEFTKSKKLLKQNPGLQFEKAGKMVSRSNSSWCGTPPITYRNYDGVYTINPSDSTLHTIYEFWGGKIDQTFKIKSISSSEMVLESIKRETLDE